MGKLSKQQPTPANKDSDGETIKAVTGEVLRAHRRDRKLTQRDIGVEAERDPVYVSNVERGLQSPTLVTLFKLVRLFDIPLSDIIKEIEQKLAAKAEGE